MSVFDDAIAAGLAALKATCGVAAVYRRGDAAVSLTVIPGESGVTVATNQNLRIRQTIRDWLIDAADLDFGDGPFEPGNADVIEVGPLRFEVESPEGGTPWRWHDLARTRYRIHSREI